MIVTCDYIVSVAYHKRRPRLSTTPIDRKYDNDEKHREETAIALKKDSKDSKDLNLPISPVFMRPGGILLPHRRCKRSNADKCCTLKSSTSIDWTRLPLMLLAGWAR